MGIEHEEALALACHYDEMIRDRAKFDKSEAVRKLAAFGLFTMQDIAKILSTTFEYAQNNAGAYVSIGPSNVNRVWNINHLTTLYLVAHSYRAGITHDGLIRKMVQNGTSVRAISELTGVPRERIREVVLDT